MNSQLGIAYVLLILVHASCASHTETPHKIVLDKEIQKAVEREIVDTLQEENVFFEPFYMNKLNLDVYSNDTLQFSTGGQDKYKQFRSYWGEVGDTTVLTGFFGGGGEGRYGFELEIIDHVPKVYLYLSSHIQKQFSYTSEGPAQFAIKVPAETSKVTLSAIPDPKHPDTIFGLLEFKSETFFQINEYTNGEETPGHRDRVRSAMKIYFKANRCDSLERG